MPNTSLEKRLCRLEQRRSNAKTMCVLHPGCYEHIGAFKVITGRHTYIEQRQPDEAWNDFAGRMDAHASGILRLLQFVPISDDGEQLYMNDETSEEHAI